jgi:hypothetical protein
MTRTRFSLALTFTIALMAAACSTGKPGPTAQATPADQASEAPPAGQSEDVLIVRRLEPAGNDGFAVVLGATGEVAFTVPDGAASRGFQRVATATADGNSTTVRFLAGEGGEVRAERQLDGSWQLPTIGVAKRPAGISANGTTVVLEQPHSTPRDSTSFAVVKASGSNAAKVFTFSGDLSFDALSADGAWLYVIVHRPGGIYEVRRASTATGALEPNVIVDKRKPGEVMAGYAITQLAGRNGWVYTLYQGPEGPFVHALQTEDGAAACIDLPKSDKAVETDATAAAWGLALSRNGRSLYAVNSALGTVNELSLEDFELERTATLAKQSAGVELAKFENAAWSDAGSAALSPDGKILYVGGPHGVSAIGTADFGSIATLGGDRGYRSLGVSAGGQVYAIDTSGRLHRLGSADAPAEAPLATDGLAVIEAVLTLRG